MLRVSLDNGFEEDLDAVVVADFGAHRVQLGLGETGQVAFWVDTGGCACSGIGLGGLVEPDLEHSVSCGTNVCKVCHCAVSIVSAWPIRLRRAVLLYSRLELRRISCSCKYTVRNSIEPLSKVLLRPSV